MKFSTFAAAACWVLAIAAILVGWDDNAIVAMFMAASGWTYANIVERERRQG